MCFVARLAPWATLTLTLASCAHAAESPSAGPMRCHEAPVSPDQSDGHVGDPPSGPTGDAGRLSVTYPSTVCSLGAKESVVLEAWNDSALSAQFRLVATDSGRGYSTYSADEHVSVLAVMNENREISIIEFWILSHDMRTGRAVESVPWQVTWDNVRASLHAVVDAVSSKGMASDIAQAVSELAAESSYGKATYDREQTTAYVQSNQHGMMIALVGR